MLDKKLTIWPVGIDTDFWKPSGSIERDTLLIYNKGQDAMCDNIKSRLSRESIRFEVLSYGAYTRDQYHAVLERSWGMIWLSPSESQGLAVLEAMSMNVPVLAWDRGLWSFFSPTLRQAFSRKATSVPYFDHTCGVRFTSLAEFEGALSVFREGRDRFRPRDYVFCEKLDLQSNLARLEPLRDLLASKRP